jgi:hypothetical protein
LFWIQKPRRRRELSLSERGTKFRVTSWGAEQDGMITLDQMSNQRGWTEPSSNYNLSKIPEPVKGFQLCCLLNIDVKGLANHWLRREDKGEWRHKNQFDSPVQNYVNVDNKR